MVLLVWLIYEVRFGNSFHRSSRRRWLDESYEYELKHLNPEEAARRHKKRLAQIYGCGVWQLVKKICGIV